MVLHDGCVRNLLELVTDFSPIGPRVKVWDEAMAGRSS